MKRVLIYISILAIAISCSKIEETILKDDSKDCVVSLSFVGEITTSETPLTKASTNSNSIYAVQVYKGNDPFAFGFFDDLSQVKLNLKQGSTYSVRSCMVKDVKSLINYYSLTNGGLKFYGSNGPFALSDYRSSGDYIKLNTFFYNSNGWYDYYSSSTATTTARAFYPVYCNHIREGELNGVQYPSCYDWFYGEYNNYTPTGEFGTIDIPLKRTGFKLKYELLGVTDGQVTVKIYNSSRTFIENTTTTSSFSSDTQFIAFYDTFSAWQYADNYTENMTVAVTWVRGIGITQNLGTKTVQIKRNCLNNIKITLGSDDRGAGVSLNAEAESSMGSAENNIPVQ